MRAAPNVAHELQKDSWKEPIKLALKKTNIHEGQRASLRENKITAPIMDSY